MAKVTRLERIHSLADLRRSHRDLLAELSSLADGALPKAYLDRIAAFQDEAAALGRLLPPGEERIEAQSVLTFWSTVLFNSDRREAARLLASFDEAAAYARAEILETRPYKGLEPFQTGDRESFFGRRRAVDALLAKIGELKEVRILAVTGLSGSGKSSVVRAGLIPALADGAIAGSEDWEILPPIVPGQDPLLALASLAPIDGSPIAQSTHLREALDRLGRPVVISVDQFEETFTVAAQETRALFLDNLLEAARNAAYPHIVILTMRSEYDTWVELFPPFAEAFNAGRVPIGALSGPELRQAIQQPAAKLGVIFEAGLVEELVEQVLGEPAGLPLLQFTLLELWRRREGPTLTWSAYRDLGGNPRGILTARAEEIYLRQLGEDRRLSESLFQALAQVGAGLELTSRRLTRAQLTERIPGAPRDNLNEVIGLWRANGLLRVTPTPPPIMDASQVEVAHESLIRNWDRYQEWLQEGLKSSRRRRLLSERAAAWKAGKDTLLGELSLQEAQAYDDFEPLEAEYVAKSRRAVDRSRRRLLTIRATAAVAAALALGLIYVAQDRLRAAQDGLIEADRAVRRAHETMTELTERLESVRKATRLSQLAMRLDAEVAGRNLDAARLAAGRATSELVRIRAARAEVSTNLTAERTEYDRLRRENASLRTEAEKAAKQADQLKGDLAAAEAETRAANAALQALVDQRPAIAIRNGVLDYVPPTWALLSERQAQISSNARSVGFVMKRPSADGRAVSTPYVGTTFLIADEVAVVPRYVLDAANGIDNLWISFSDSAPGAFTDAFRVQRILTEVKAGDHSLVFLELKDDSPSGQKLPPPLRVAPTSPGPATDIYIIGYPSADVRASEASRAILKMEDGIKRVQPGVLLSANSADSPILTYDVSTFVGNGGSPVIDLATGEVIGVHIGGSPISSANDTRTRRGILLDAAILTPAVRRILKMDRR